MRVTAHFVMNLRRETASDEFVAFLMPWGWLSAPTNTTAATRTFAGEAARRGREMFADNGNFSRIGDITKPLVVPAKRIHTEIDILERQLGRPVGRGDFPPALLAQVDDLERQVRQAVTGNLIDPNAAVQAQLSMTPTRVVGVEDITMACLLVLHLERDYLDSSRRRLRSINRAVARAAVRAQKSLPPGVRDYPVASAMDYETAVDAGLEFGRRGLERVAMGFGAYMADDYSTDRVHIGRKVVRFGENLPRRYLRTALAARGFMDGYTKAAGGPPQAFHFLGLGAPIMMGVVAAAFSATPLLTFDATSPIKDATSGSLYTTKPAYLKLRTRAVARSVADGRTQWACPCRFCREFSAQHPPSYAAAHRWGSAHPAVSVTAADLRPGGDLYAALPLLAEPPSGPLRREVTYARMGHNHWVLCEVCADLRYHSERNTLIPHVRQVIDQYEMSTRSARFARAVRFGMDLATGAAP